jgi:hypothetical protein
LGYTCSLLQGLGTWPKVLTIVQDLELFFHEAILVDSLNNLQHEFALEDIQGKCWIKDTTDSVTLVNLDVECRLGFFVS